MEHSGEHDVKNGAYLWIPPEALAEAITSGALDCAASLSWIPGSAARRELDGEGRLISANDGYGWVVTEKEGHHPAWVSLASYLRAEYENLMLPSHQLKTVGWLAEDIPEPYYSNLAKLVLGVTAARKGKKIKIEQVRQSGGQLIASYSQGRPYEGMRFRGREVTFEKVKGPVTRWLSSLRWTLGRKQTHSQ